MATSRKKNKAPRSAAPGVNATTESPARARVDASSYALTTNREARIAGNQNSLNAGLREPALLENFILRESFAHFDREPASARSVHGRGFGAHGYFVCYDALTQYTRAAPFSDAGKITPVLVRFSTAARERGFKDSARDVHGFSVRFYTDEGNWDLVGNNMPVFFIQDAMKLPDLVHAVKPELHCGTRGAASVHDTFWDFVSLMPETTHMLMWIMSDRAIPRSLRMMQGFGVHTFRLVNDGGGSVFCKFHWKPLFGTHSLVWDEAVKISGADPDFHRRDLWEAIESGDFPEWELGLQIFTEEQSNGFSFDVLDATKLIPEELVPVVPVGRMGLNRYQDIHLVETGQAPFCAAHVIPGIDFSNDPLLAGRLHSYIDTQMTRFGGAHFHEIPLDSPPAARQKGQRDGVHRQALKRRRASYEPNSLAGGCPFQAGSGGFVSFSEPVHEGGMRGKRDRFSEHYAQATLFFDSQTDIEKAHIIAAFRLELSKVGVLAIRERMLASLVNVSSVLAAEVAAGLGMAVPDTLPKTRADRSLPEVLVSPSLSLRALPGECGIRTRQVAILVADGVHRASIAAIQQAIVSEGAVGHFVGPRIGKFATEDGAEIEADKSMENSPAVLFDALVLPDGVKAIETLAADGHTMEYLKDQFRHCKAILALGASRMLLEMAGIGAAMGKDAGILLAERSKATDAVPDFIAAIAAHRHPGRDSDPPRIQVEAPGFRSRPEVNVA